MCAFSVELFLPFFVDRDRFGIITSRHLFQLPLTRFFKVLREGPRTKNPGYTCVEGRQHGTGRLVLTSISRQ